MDKNKLIKKSNNFNEKAQVFLIIVFVVLALIFIGLLGYYIYLDIPGNPQELNISFGNQNFSLNNSADYNTGTEVKQFYPNMKFNHNMISYSIDLNCNQDKINQMIGAFDEISSKVGEISFYDNTDSNKPSDIEVSCSPANKVSVNEDYFIAGEGGAKEVVQTGKYNVITNGIILLYNDKNSIKCSEPNVELHELMHVFGFGHSSSKNSLMYPLLDSCNQKLDDSIITELNRLYSEENLPDLYFDNITAIMKGRYLDFNLTIKNSGDVDAKNVSYSVLDEGDLVETRYVGDIKFGAGIAVWVENFKLIHRNPSQISFVIDMNNSIQESDKSNNIVVINTK